MPERHHNTFMSEITFSTLGVPAPLVAKLTAEGITSPFPIQVDSLPDTLAGRDVLGRGKTGSGKTLAFAIPMVTRLGGKLAGGHRRPGRPLGLVLAPTRELATQITHAMEPLAEAYGLKITTIFGGVSQQRQVAALKGGIDIVVACPGRLEDLMKQGFVALDAVEITVLDEADHMADLGFLPVVTRILDKTPNNGQRLLFSATLDNGVDKIVKKFLHNEVLHSVDDASSHVEAMTHHVFEVDSVDAKNELIKKLASGTGRRILFMRTKHHAKKLARQLTDAGIPSVDLHGNLSPAAARPQPRRVRRRLCASARGNGCRGSRRPRRRHRTRHPRRPAGRAQGVPAPLRPHRSRGQARARSSPSCCPPSARTPRRCCARQKSASFPST